MYVQYICVTQGLRQKYNVEQAVDHASGEKRREIWRENKFSKVFTVLVFLANHRKEESCFKILACLSSCMLTHSVTAYRRSVPKHFKREVR